MDKERALTEARTHLGRIVGRRWRLERVLGAGSLGAVYAGTHRSGRLGALKLLPAALRDDVHFRDRFLREAYLANHVDHPGILPILDDGEDELGPFLVMELLDGWSLADKLTGAVLPLERVLAIAAEILRALKAAHRRGIVHRDVKPSNIFLCRNGSIKLLDFGTARVVHEEQGLLTRMGLLLGTPAYMAPEVARGDEVIDGRADLYSLAATLFHAVTGRTVHLASTSGQMLGLVATTPAPRVRDVAPDLNETLAALLDRALAFDRDKRPRTADRWLTSVEAVRSGMATPKTLTDSLTGTPETPVLAVPEDLTERLEEKRREVKRHLAAEEEEMAGSQDTDQTFAGGSTPSSTEPSAPQRVADAVTGPDETSQPVPHDPPSKTSRATQKMILSRSPEPQPETSAKNLKPAPSAPSQPTQRIWVARVVERAKAERARAESASAAERAKRGSGDGRGSSHLPAARPVGEATSSTTAPSSRGVPSFRLHRWPSADDVQGTKPALGMPALAKEVIPAEASMGLSWPTDTSEQTTGKHAPMSRLAHALRAGVPRRAAGRPVQSRSRRLLEAQVPLYVWFIVGAFLAALIWVVIVVFASMWLSRGAKVGV